MRNQPRSGDLHHPDVDVALLRARRREERRDPRGREELVHRVRCEFEEMPGLSLTVGQAARLFGLDPAAAARVLGALVDGGLLQASIDGRYRLGRPAA